MKKIILSIIVIFIFFGCQKKEVIIFVGQPSDPLLDNSQIIINLDNVKIYDGYLKTTSIASSYSSFKSPILSDGKHELKIFARDSIYNFSINYPNDKYIIVSTFLKKNGKTKVSILKRNKKFIVH